ncbi:MAG: hypothetical protein PW734_03620 [Verrucomicrobium sp.]|nr:hypothetical protein [Verrucomicrobium sp.]
MAGAALALCLIGGAVLALWQDGPPPLENFAVPALQVQITPPMTVIVKGTHARGPIGRYDLMDYSLGEEIAKSLRNQIKVR